MQWLISALICFCMFVGLIVSGDPMDGRGDSSFKASESLSTSIVKDDAKRNGWEERKFGSRFGSYSFSVTQRIDPKTGYPPSKRKWGDSFFCLNGKKPASYMASNWSPWGFLVPEIYLDAGKKMVPPVTLNGRCEFVGLRETSPNKIVSEAVFRDLEDGIFIVRFVGLPQYKDRFGLWVRYQPPKNKLVTKAVYTFTCQPYDYSDRGYWQRRRWLTTPDFNSQIKNREKIEGDLLAAKKLVFHNRLAMTDAGCFMFLPDQGIKDVSVNGAGKTIKVHITPKNCQDWTPLILGDWIKQANNLKADQLFRETNLADQFKQFEPGKLPLPEKISVEMLGDLKKLLTRHKELNKQYGDLYKKFISSYKSSYKKLQNQYNNDQKLSYNEMLKYKKDKEQLSKLIIDVRTMWVNKKLWKNSF